MTSRAAPKVERQLYSQRKAITYLGGDDVLADCVEAGWFKARASKFGKDGRPTLKLYAARDLNLALQRIEDGEYPQTVCP